MKNNLNNTNKSTLLQLAIFCFTLSFLLSVQSVFAAGNPFDTINTNLSSFADTIVKIVQVIGIIALVGFGAYVLFSGNLDKVRLGMLVIGIIIVAGAKPIVTFFSGWIK
jgi:type IV secretory pathway VirB2 component (pilin)